MDQFVVASGSPRFIGRQLALGFGSVSVVAIAMCALLVVVIYAVAGMVDSMRRDEGSIVQGMELAAIVRELSANIEQLIIGGDKSRLEQYQWGQEQIRARIGVLDDLVPDDERYRLDQLSVLSRDMDELLSGSILPALQSGDSNAALLSYRRLEQLGEAAVQHADILALAATRHMAHIHEGAVSYTRLGVIGGSFCVVIIVVLSVAFTLQLRAVVLRPLQRLTEAAWHYGRGDFGFRLGDVGRGELAAVGEAFSRMAEELGQREARLLHNERMERMAVIGQLAAGVAHELNTPIGIIRGYLKMMKPDEDARILGEELAILDEEAGHCERIANDLLAYARAESLVIDQLGMAGFLAEAASRYEVGAGDVKIELVVSDAVIAADRARLRQLILNLLNNAGQVSPPGSSVRLCGELQGDCYRIEVIDHGPGVCDSDKQRIFEPFFSRRKGGSGLGLAVCKGIVEAHGGSIMVRDQPEGGAIFCIMLPVHGAGSDQQ